MKIKKQPKIILGFVGKLCAGKGAAISYLVEKHGFYASSCSDRIREAIRADGLEVTREKLLEFGGKLREEFGPEALAKLTWEKISREGVKKAVVDSIRAKGEAEFFKTLPNFHLIAIDSDQKTRFERMKTRNRGESDPTTFEEFQKTEEVDISGGGRDVEAVIQMADFKIENNGTERKLHQKLDKLLEELLEK
ncbi:MAG: AAA family ATPase [Candidatus Daviesbacteria bacterium]|nr:AAA family ATPase [Candidatus Daviesbacteria bacterium]